MTGDVLLFMMGRCMQLSGSPHLVIGGELAFEQDEKPAVAEVEILRFLDLLHQFWNISNSVGVMLKLTKGSFAPSSSAAYQI